MPRQSLDWLRLMLLLAVAVAVAVLFPLTPLVGQLSILRGNGHLMGLFYLEEHWRWGTVLHGPEFTGSMRTILISQQHKYNKCVTVCGFELQSPFLCVELDQVLLKFSLLISRLYTDPVWVVPQLVLLQANLCCKHCFAVRAAVTQLLTYCGLM